MKENIMVKKLKGGKGTPKTGLSAKGVLRPHVWIVGPDEYKHKMYHPWQMAKAQANYRGEDWDLPFEDFFDLWDGLWDQRGRNGEDYCLSRVDPTEPWARTNCEVRIRKELLAEQNTMKAGFRGASYSTKPKTVVRSFKE
jgi:hypothetical protein